MKAHPPGTHGWITIEGARQHNLKNIRVNIPKGALTVVTGPSGSGKSSLVFDTLFAEAQRRFMQSLPARSRQLLDLMEKPAVEKMTGLCPVIAIEQQTASPSPRSTLATATELHEFLRDLFAACGRAHHPETGRPLQRRTAQQLVDELMREPPGTRLILLAPIELKSPTSLASVLELLKKDGFIRARVDGKILDLEHPDLALAKTARTVEVVVDRLILTEGARTRLSESVETALERGGGWMIAHFPDRAEDRRLSHDYFDPESGFRFPPLTHRHFSFNNPLGACPVCQGLGTIEEVDPDLLVPDPNRSLRTEPIEPWRLLPARVRKTLQAQLLAFAQKHQVDQDTPWHLLPETFRHEVLHEKKNTYVGVVNWVRHMLAQADDPTLRQKLQQFVRRQTCPACQGARLKPEILAVTVGFDPESTERTGLGIHQLGELPLSELRSFLHRLAEQPEVRQRTGELLHELLARLTTLERVGLGYLNLNREMATLSNGEVQRVRLATQIGAALSGVLYILDEPSSGLHPADIARLIETLKNLCDLGNTVVVVEHDESIMRAADWLIDIGPEAGARGGQLLSQGPPEEILRNPTSPTANYLTGQLSLKPRPVSPDGRWLRIRGAWEHNLKGSDFSFPIGCLTCVAGVSGSGKSTLIHDVLGRGLRRALHRTTEPRESCDAIEGIENLSRVVLVDQEPIGRSPRSNLLTYLGVFDAIRQLYAKTPAARVRGYDAGRFSFNRPGGRCEHCRGEGVLRVEMHFMPDVFVTCPECGGKRFNRDTLEITYRGRHIADVLAMTVQEGIEHFNAVPQVADPLKILARLGLAYLPLGQPSHTLSGGEAQRIRLAAELARPHATPTCFLLDEPTTGLHMVDILPLMDVLWELRGRGHTIILIEHQLDVLAAADYIVEMGPGSGDQGGSLVFEGPVEAWRLCESSPTARFLKPRAKTFTS